MPHTKTLRGGAKTGIFYRIMNGVAGIAIGTSCLFLGCCDRNSKMQKPIKRIERVSPQRREERKVNIKFRHRLTQTKARIQEIRRKAK